MTFAEYLRFVDKRLRQNPDWRVGQAFFNSLYEVNPNLTAEVWGTERDPFHNNLFVPAFLSYVAEHWEDKP